MFWCKMNLFGLLFSFVFLFVSNYQVVGTDRAPKRFQRHWNCGCSKVSQPVCGKDGYTYRNNCLAKCAGVYPEHYGPCSNQHWYLLGVISGNNTFKVNTNIFDTITKITEHKRISTTPRSINPKNLVPVNCNKPNNLVIILDSSNSVNNLEYKLEREFAAKIAFAWKQNPGSSIAIVIFANRVDTFMVFEDSQMLAAEMLRDNILNAKRLPGSSKTHLALEAATKLVTSETTSAANNVLLLTKGLFDDYPATVEVAKQIRNLGVQVVVLGIGTMSNGTELIDIAGKQENVFLAKDLEILEGLLGPVTRTICEGSIQDY